MSSFLDQEYSVIDQDTYKQALIELGDKLALTFGLERGQFHQAIRHGEISRDAMNLALEKARSFAHQQSQRAKTAAEEAARVAESMYRSWANQIEKEREGRNAEVNLTNADTERSNHKVESENKLAEASHARAATIAPSRGSDVSVSRVGKHVEGVMRQAQNPSSFSWVAAVASEGRTPSRKGSFIDSVTRPQATKGTAIPGMR